MKKTMIVSNKINDAVMKNAPLDTLIALCRDIDLESCFDPVFEPFKSFLDVCKRYWENYYAEIMKSKPSVPMFYAQGEDGTLYFYHGNTPAMHIRQHLCGRTGEETLRMDGWTGQKHRQK